MGRATDHLTQTVGKQLMYLLPVMTMLIPGKPLLDCLILELRFLIIMGHTDVTTDINMILLTCQTYTMGIISCCPVRPLAAWNRKGLFYIKGRAVARSSF